MAKNAATEAALGSLHEQLAKVLAAAISEEGVTAAVLSVARGFLKDNDITASADGNAAMDDLKNKLAAQGAPPDDVADKELDAALADVLDIQQYRTGGR